MEQNFEEEDSKVSVRKKRSDNYCGIAEDPPDDLVRLYNHLRDDLIELEEEFDAELRLWKEAADRSANVGFVGLVGRMRNSQIGFFASDHGTLARRDFLRQSKCLEREVDTLLTQYKSKQRAFLYGGDE